MKSIGDLSVGTKVKYPGLKLNGEDVNWIILEHNHEGDPENSTTLMMEKIYFQMEFDAGEQGNSLTKYGNADYEKSNILQWLNSDSGVGEWYTPQHQSDQTPSYVDDSGFLYKLPEAFKRNLIEISKPSFIPEENEKIDVTRKIHLLSGYEVGFIASSESQQEGTKYEFFSDATSRIAYRGTASTDWYTRTSFMLTSEMKQLAVVTENGGLAYGYAAGLRGIRPICAIPKITEVSGNPDGNGVYTIVFESEPDDSWIPPDGIWRTPKTNWAVEDRFNFTDYNRILNNLTFLREKVSELKEEFGIVDMGLAINSYKVNWNVEYFNAFESNVDLINKNLLSKDYGFRQTFYPNGIFIGFAELNRIESAILEMKRTVDGIISGRVRLSFRLGAPKGLRI